jgi:hypothetical protein
VIDTICFADQLFHELLFEDGVDDQSKTFLVLEMLYVGITAVERSSMTVISCPPLISLSARWLPTNPAPPVMRVFIIR